MYADESDVRPRPERRPEDVLQGRGDGLARDAAPADLFGDFRDAVIGAQPEHVVAGARRRRRGARGACRSCDRAGPERPGPRGCADRRRGRRRRRPRSSRRESRWSCPVPSLQRVDGRGGHAPEILVGVRRLLPAGVEIRIGLPARHRRADAGRSCVQPATLPSPFIVVLALIRRRRQRALPDLVVVGADGIGVDERLQERNGLLA